MAFELSIGGLRFQARLPCDVRLVEDDVNYRTFVSAPAALPGDVVVPVGIELGAAPDVEALPRIFEAGTWSAHRGDGETILRLRTPRGPDSYLWTARLGSSDEDDRVTIHCGSLLVERGEGGIRVRSPLHYPLDQLLTMYSLVPRRGLICHAAGISIDGRGLLLAGRSGAGKTTFMRVAAQRPEIEGLSDDRVVVRRVDGAMLVYGTPWAGEGQVAANRAVALSALIFLHQAPRNELRAISPGEALEQLLPVVSVLWFDEERMERATAFCGELVEALPSYELHFRPEAAALDVLAATGGRRLSRGGCPPAPP